MQQGKPEKALHKRVAKEKLEFDTRNSLVYKRKDLTWAKIHLETCKQGRLYRTYEVYKEKNIIFAFFIDFNKNQKEHYPNNALIMNYLEEIRIDDNR